MMRRRVSRQGVLACVLTLLASQMPGVLQAQTDAQTDSQTPVFRLQVRRVPVDVVVLDKAGNPVRGLTKDDFLVKEDGKAQGVLSFDFYDGSKPDFVPPHAPPLPANFALAPVDRATSTIRRFSGATGMIVRRRSKLSFITWPNTSQSPAISCACACAISGGSARGGTAGAAGK